MQLEESPPTRFNRQKISLFVGSIVLSLGVIFPWYQLPPETLKAFEVNLFWVNSFKILAAVFVIIGLAHTFWFRTINRFIRIVFWSGLIVVLLFPYLVVNWLPTVNLLAQYNYLQSEKVALHVEMNYAENQANWKQRISLDPPVDITSISASDSSISINDSRFFQLSSWDQILTDWLGYSEGLLMFIGKGWIFTAIGLVLCLFTIYVVLELGDEGINIFIQDMGKLWPLFILILGFILSTITLFNTIDYELETKFAKGEYSQVGEISRNLALWYPRFKGDETFLQRWGDAEFYTQTPNTDLINFAKGLEAYQKNNLQRSVEHFQMALARNPNLFLARSYLANIILTQGVNYFNNGESGAAINSFKEVLRIFPGNLEALYNLMLAQVVQGEFAESAKVGEQIISIQKYFQIPKDVITGQAYLHKAWNEYQQGNVIQAWEKYRQSIDTRTWKR